MKIWKPFIGGSPYLVHSPPGPRNGGIPLSTDIPAPVSAIGYRASMIISAVSRTSSSLALSLFSAIVKHLTHSYVTVHEINVNAYTDTPACSARRVIAPDT